MHFARFPSAGRYWYRVPVQFVGGYSRPGDNSWFRGCWKFGLIGGDAFMIQAAVQARARVAGRLPPCSWHGRCWLVSFFVSIRSFQFGQSTASSAHREINWRYALDVYCHGSGIFDTLIRKPQLVCWPAVSFIDHLVTNSSQSETKKTITHLSLVSTRMICRRRSRH